MWCIVWGSTVEWEVLGNVEGAMCQPAQYSEELDWDNLEVGLLL